VLWGHEMFGVEPDIMTLAKGLAGGVPISAVLAKEHASVFEPGDHGSTFGGNPLACAVGAAVMREGLERDLPAYAARMGERFRQGLGAMRARWPAIRGGRGRGLLLAVQVGHEGSEALLEAALERGLLLNAVTPSALRFMPPLVITEAEVDEALSKLEPTLASTLERARAAG